MAGNCYLLEAAFRGCPAARDAVLFVRPETLATNLDSQWTYDFFCGLFHTPAQIAEVIQATLNQQQTQAQELLDLYDKVIEAIDLLSTPPDSSNIKDPNELRQLLSERLDDIHSVAGKTIRTIASVRSKNPEAE